MNDEYVTSLPNLTMTMQRDSHAYNLGVGVQRGQSSQGGGSRYRNNSVDNTNFVPVAGYFDILREYLLLLNNPTIPAREVPTVMRRMLRDPVFFAAIEDIPVELFANSLREAETRWWNVSPRAKLRCCPTITTRKNDEERERYIDTRVATQPLCQPALLRPAPTLLTSMSAQETRTLNEEIRAALTLLVTMIAPYRVLRPTYTPQMSCTSRLMLCGDASVIYLGLLINAGIRQVGHLMQDMPVLRIVAHGWGSSPSFKDILQANWQLYRRCKAELRQKIASMPVSASSAGPEASTTAVSEEVESEVVSHFALDLPATVFEVVPKAAFATLRSDEGASHTTTSTSNKPETINLEEVANGCLKAMRASADNIVQLLWWARCRLLAFALLEKPVRESVLMGPALSFFLSLWSCDELITAILEDEELSVPSTQPDTAEEEEEDSAQPMKEALNTLRELYANLIGTIADLSHFWSVVHNAANPALSSAAPTINSVWTIVNTLVPGRGRFRRDHFASHETYWQYALLIGDHITGVLHKGLDHRVQFAVAPMVYLLQHEPDYCAPLILRCLVFTNSKEITTEALQTGLLRAIVACLRHHLPDTMKIPAAHTAHRPVATSDNVPVTADTNSGEQQQHEGSSSSNAPVNTEDEEKSTKEVDDMAEADSTMPEITLQAYSSIQACLEALTECVLHYSHPSINPVAFLLTAGMDDDEEEERNNSGEDVVHMNATESNATAQSGDMRARSAPATTNTRSVELVALLHALVLQTRYSGLASSTLTLLAACAHHNVRDMVPAFVERGLVQTTLAIARRPLDVTAAYGSTTAVRYRHIINSSGSINNSGAENTTNGENDSNHDDEEGEVQVGTGEDKAALLTSDKDTVQENKQQQHTVPCRPQPVRLVRHQHHPYSSDNACTIYLRSDHYSTLSLVHLALPTFVQALTVHNSTHDHFTANKDWLRSVAKGLCRVPLRGVQDAIQACTVADNNLSLTQPFAKLPSFVQQQLVTVQYLFYEACEAPHTTILTTGLKDLFLTFDTLPQLVNDFVDTLCTVCDEVLVVMHRLVPCAAPTHTTTTTPAQTHRSPYASLQLRSLTTPPEGLSGRNTTLTPTPIYMPMTGSDEENGERTNNNNNNSNNNNNNANEQTRASPRHNTQSGNDEDNTAEEEGHDANDAARRGATNRTTSPSSPQLTTAQAAALIGTFCSLVRLVSITELLFLNNSRLAERANEESENPTHVLRRGVRVAVLPCVSRMLQWILLLPSVDPGVHVPEEVTKAATIPVIHTSIGVRRTNSSSGSEAEQQQPLRQRVVRLSSGEAHDVSTPKTTTALPTATTITTTSNTENISHGPFYAVAALKMVGVNALTTFLTHGPRMQNLQFISLLTKYVTTLSERSTAIAERLASQEQQEQNSCDVNTEGVITASDAVLLKQLTQAIAFMQRRTDLSDFRTSFFSLALNVFANMRRHKYSLTRHLRRLAEAKTVQRTQESNTTTTTTAAEADRNDTLGSTPVVNEASSATERTQQASTPEREATEQTRVTGEDVESTLNRDYFALSEHYDSDGESLLEVPPYRANDNDNSNATPRRTSTSRADNEGVASSNAFVTREGNTATQQAPQTTVTSDSRRRDNNKKKKTGSEEMICTAFDPVEFLAKWMQSFFFRVPPHNSARMSERVQSMWVDTEYGSLSTELQAAAMMLIVKNHLQHLCNDIRQHAAVRALCAEERRTVGSRRDNNDVTNTNNEENEEEGGTIHGGDVNLPTTTTPPSGTLSESAVLAQMLNDMDFDRLQEAVLYVMVLDMRGSPRMQRSALVLNARPEFTEYFHAVVSYVEHLAILFFRHSLTFVAADVLPLYTREQQQQRSKAATSEGTPGQEGNEEVNKSSEEWVATKLAELNYRRDCLRKLLVRLTYGLVCLTMGKSMSGRDGSTSRGQQKLSYYSAPLFCFLFDTWPTLDGLPAVPHIYLLALTQIRTEGKGFPAVYDVGGGAVRPTPAALQRLGGRYRSLNTPVSQSVSPTGQMPNMSPANAAAALMSLLLSSGNRTEAVAETNNNTTNNVDTREGEALPPMRYDRPAARRRSRSHQRRRSHRRGGTSGSATVEQHGFAFSSSEAEDSDADNNNNNEEEDSLTSNSVVPAPLLDSAASTPLPSPAIPPASAPPVPSAPLITSPRLTLRDLLRAGRSSELTALGLRVAPAILPPAPAAQPTSTSETNERNSGGGGSGLWWELVQAQQQQGGPDAVPRMTALLTTTSRLRRSYSETKHTQLQAHTVSWVCGLICGRYFDLDTLSARGRDTLQSNCCRLLWHIWSLRTESTRAYLLPVLLQQVMENMRHNHNLLEYLAVLLTQRDTLPMCETLALTCLPSAITDCVLRTVRTLDDEEAAAKEAADEEETKNEREEQQQRRRRQLRKNLLAQLYNFLLIFRNFRLFIAPFQNSPSTPDLCTYFTSKQNLCWLGHHCPALHCLTKNVLQPGTTLFAQSDEDWLSNLGPGQLPELEMMLDVLESYGYASEKLQPPPSLPVATTNESAEQPTTTQVEGDAAQSTSETTMHQETTSREANHSRAATASQAQSTITRTRGLGGRWPEPQPALPYFDESLSAEEALQQYWLSIQPSSPPSSPQLIIGGELGVRMRPVGGNRIPVSSGDPNVIHWTRPSPRYGDFAYYPTPSSPIPPPPPPYTLHQPYGTSPVLRHGGQSAANVSLLPSRVEGTTDYAMRLNAASSPHRGLLPPSQLASANLNSHNLTAPLLHSPVAEDAVAEDGAYVRRYALMNPWTTRAMPLATMQPNFLLLRKELCAELLAFVLHDLGSPAQDGPVVTRFDQEPPPRPTRPRTSITTTTTTTAIGDLEITVTVLEGDTPSSPLLASARQRALQQQQQQQQSAGRNSNTADSPASTTLLTSERLQTWQERVERQHGVHATERGWRMEDNRARAQKCSLPELTTQLLALLFASHYDLCDHYRQLLGRGDRTLLGRLCSYTLQNAVFHRSRPAAMELMHFLMDDPMRGEAMVYRRLCEALRDAVKSRRVAVLTEEAYEALLHRNDVLPEAEHGEGDITVANAAQRSTEGEVHDRNEEGDEEEVYSVASAHTQPAPNAAAAQVSAGQSPHEVQNAAITSTSPQPQQQGTTIDGAPNPISSTTTPAGSNTTAAAIPLHRHIAPLALVLTFLEAGLRYMPNTVYAVLEQCCVLRWVCPAEDELQKAWVGIWISPQEPQGINTNNNTTAPSSSSAAAAAASHTAAPAAHNNNDEEAAAPQHSTASALPSPSLLPLTAPAQAALAARTTTPTTSSSNEAAPIRRLVSYAAHGPGTTTTTTAPPNVASTQPSTCSANTTMSTTQEKIPTPPVLVVPPPPRRHVRGMLEFVLTELLCAMTSQRLAYVHVRHVLDCLVDQPLLLTGLSSHHLSLPVPEAFAHLVTSHSSQVPEALMTATNTAAATPMAAAAAVTSSANPNNTTTNINSSSGHSRTQSRRASHQSPGHGAAHTMQHQHYHHHHHHPAMTPELHSRTHVTPNATNSHATAGTTVSRRVRGRSHSRARSLSPLQLTPRRRAMTTHYTDATTTPCAATNNNASSTQLVWVPAYVAVALYFSGDDQDFPSSFFSAIAHHMPHRFAADLAHVLDTILQRCKKLPQSNEMTGVSQPVQRDTEATAAPFTSSVEETSALLGQLICVILHILRKSLVLSESSSVASRLCEELLRQNTLQLLYDVVRLRCCRCERDATTLLLLLRRLLTAVRQNSKGTSNNTPLVAQAESRDVVVVEGNGTTNADTQATADAEPQDRERRANEEEVQTQTSTHPTASSGEPMTNTMPPPSTPPNAIRTTDTTLTTNTNGNTAVLGGSPAIGRLSRDGDAIVNSVVVGRAAGEGDEMDRLVRPGDVLAELPSLQSEDRVITPRDAVLLLPPTEGTMAGRRVGSLLPHHHTHSSNHHTTTTTSTSSPHHHHHHHHHRTATTSTSSTSMSSYDQLDVYPPLYAHEVVQDEDDAIDDDEDEESDVIDDEEFEDDDEVTSEAPEDEEVQEGEEEEGQDEEGQGVAEANNEEADEEAAANEVMAVLEGEELEDELEGTHEEPEEEQPDDNDNNDEEEDEDDDDEIDYYYLNTGDYDEDIMNEMYDHLHTDEGTEFDLGMGQSSGLEHTAAYDAFVRHGVIDVLNELGYRAELRRLQPRHRAALGSVLTATAATGGVAAHGTREARQRGTSGAVQWPTTSSYFFTSPSGATTAGVTTGGIDNNYAAGGGVSALTHNLLRPRSNLAEMPYMAMEASRTHNAATGGGRSSLGAQSLACVFDGLVLGLGALDATTQIAIERPLTQSVVAQGRTSTTATAAPAATTNEGNTQEEGATAAEASLQRDDAAAANNSEDNSTTTTQAEEEEETHVSTLAESPVRQEESSVDTSAAAVPTQGAISHASDRRSYSYGPVATTATTATTTIAADEAAAPVSEVRSPSFAFITGTEGQGEGEGHNLTPREDEVQQVNATTTTTTNSNEAPLNNLLAELHNVAAAGNGPAQPPTLSLDDATRYILDLFSDSAAPGTNATTIATSTTAAQENTTTAAVSPTHAVGEGTTVTSTSNVPTTTTTTSAPLPTTSTEPAPQSTPARWEGAIDPLFLVVLPAEMRSEIVFDYMTLLRGEECYEQLGFRTRIERGFLSQLPEETQRDVLEVEQRWLRVTGQSNTLPTATTNTTSSAADATSSGPNGNEAGANTANANTPAGDNNEASANNTNSDIIALLFALDDDVRRDALLSCDLALLQGYPQLLQEAERLRAQLAAEEEQRRVRQTAAARERRLAELLRQQQRIDRRGTRRPDTRDVFGVEDSLQDSGSGLRRGETMRLRPIWNPVFVPGPATCLPSTDTTTTTNSEGMARRGNDASSTQVPLPQLQRPSQTLNTNNTSVAAPPPVIATPSHSRPRPPARHRQDITSATNTRAAGYEEDMPLVGDDDEEGANRNTNNNIDDEEEGGSSGEPRRPRRYSGELLHVPRLVFQRPPTPRAGWRTQSPNNNNNTTLTREPERETNENNNDDDEFRRGLGSDRAHGPGTTSVSNIHFTRDTTINNTNEEDEEASRPAAANYTTSPTEGEATGRTGNQVHRVTAEELMEAYTHPYALEALFNYLIANVRRTSNNNNNNTTTSASDATPQRRTGGSNVPHAVAHRLSDAAEHTLQTNAHTGTTSTAAIPLTVRPRTSTHTMNRPNVTTAAANEVTNTSNSNNVVGSTSEALGRGLPPVPNDVLRACIDLLHFRGLASWLGGEDGTSSGMSPMAAAMAAGVPYSGDANSVGTQLHALVRGFCVDSTSAVDVLDELITSIENTIPPQPSTTATTSNNGATLTQMQQHKQMLFVMDIMQIILELVQHIRSAELAFILLPDGATSPTTVKPTDAPLSPQERSVVERALLGRLTQVVCSYAHVSHIQNIFLLFLQQLNYGVRMLTQPADDAACTDDSLTNEPLSEFVIQHVRHARKLRWTNISRLPNYDRYYYMCDVCGTNPQLDYAFHCSGCSFDLCPSCAREQLDIEQQGSRLRRAAYYMTGTPACFVPILSLLHHQYCQPNLATALAQFVSRAIHESAARDGMMLLTPAHVLASADPSTAPPYALTNNTTTTTNSSDTIVGGGSEVPAVPRPQSVIGLVEATLVDIALLCVARISRCRQRFRSDVAHLLARRRHSNATRHTTNTNNAVSEASHAARLLPPTGTATSALLQHPQRPNSSGGFMAGATLFAIELPEKFVFTITEALMLMHRMNFPPDGSNSAHYLLPPYAETHCAEPRALTLMWHATQAYLQLITLVVQHLPSNTYIPLPPPVLALIAMFCQYHLSESRRAGASTSLSVTNNTSANTSNLIAANGNSYASRSSLRGETERFMVDTTADPSALSERAVRELEAQRQQRRQQQQQQQQQLTASGVVRPSPVDGRSVMNTNSNGSEMRDGQPETRRRLPVVVRKFLEANRPTLNALLYWSPSLLNEGLAFLRSEPSLIDFNFKLRDFRSRIDLRRGERISISVNRANCLQDSFQELKKIRHLNGPLHIHFQGEEGADVGGLTREWFGLIAADIVNESYALFIHSQEYQTYQPNPFSDINANHLEYFWFIGVVLGLAVAHNVPIDIHFTRAVYRHMVGIQPVFRDLESVDPALYANLCWLLDHDATDLGLSFAVNYDRFGEMQERELVPGGKDMAVTNANKLQYVRLLCEFHMTRRVEPQLVEMLKGFYTLIPRSEARCFTEQELELVICGMPDIDVEDMRAHTVYEGYTASSPQIRWFWEAVQGMSKEDRANLLQFSTGSSKVPHGGFGAMENASGNRHYFKIAKWGVGPDLLPQAHTCFNHIDLPEYPSAEVLREKLMMAITYGSMGFALV